MYEQILFGMNFKLEKIKEHLLKMGTKEEQLKHVSQLKNKFRRWLLNFKSFHQKDYAELCHKTDKPYNEWLSKPYKLAYINVPLSNPNLEKRLKLEGYLARLEKIREKTELEFQNHKIEPLPLTEELVFSDLGDRITIEKYLEKTNTQKIKEDTEPDFQKYLANPSAYEKFNHKALPLLQQRIAIENQLDVYPGAIEELDMLLEDVKMGLFPVNKNQSLSRAIDREYNGPETEIEGYSHMRWALVLWYENNGKGIPAKDPRYNNYRRWNKDDYRTKVNPKSNLGTEEKIKHYKWAIPQITNAIEKKRAEGVLQNLENELNEIKNGK